MEKIYIQIALSCLASMTTGFVLGRLSNGYININKMFKAFVTLTIFALWTASMSLDIYKGVANTPLLLNIFMGAVIGSINHEFGEWVLKFWKRK